MTSAFSSPNRCPYSQKVIRSGADKWIRCLCVICTFSCVNEGSWMWLFQQQVFDVSIYEMSVLSPLNRRNNGLWPWSIQSEWLRPLSLYFSAGQQLMDRERKERERDCLKGETKRYLRVVPNRMHLSIVLNSIWVWWAGEEWRYTSHLLSSLKHYTSSNAERWSSSK